MKRVYRSESNKLLAGVCGGLGDYLNIDPTVIRILWVILGCCGGCGLIAYIICAIIIPSQSEVERSANNDPVETKEEDRTNEGAKEPDEIIDNKK